MQGGREEEEEEKEEKSKVILDDADQWSARHPNSPRCGGSGFMRLRELLVTRSAPDPMAIQPARWRVAHRGVPPTRRAGCHHTCLSVALAIASVANQMPLPRVNLTARSSPMATASALAVAKMSLKMPQRTPSFCLGTPLSRK